MVTSQKKWIDRHHALAARAVHELQLVSRVLVGQDAALIEVCEKGQREAQERNSQMITVMGMAGAVAPKPHPSTSAFYERRRLRKVLKERGLTVAEVLENNAYGKKFRIVLELSSTELTREELEALESQREADEEADGANAIAEATNSLIIDYLTTMNEKIPMYAELDEQLRTIDNAATALQRSTSLLRTVFKCPS